MAVLVQFWLHNIFRHKKSPYRSLENFLLFQISNLKGIISDDFSVDVFIFIGGLLKNGQRIYNTLVLTDVYNKENYDE